jgi:hypothetical protein
MAKVKMGLMSGKATGSIGGVLTFANWKGINTCRQTPMPSNPKTSKQIAQRDLLRKIVLFFKTSLTQVIARTGYNRLALTSGKIQSGFNYFVAEMVDLLRVNAQLMSPLTDIGIVTNATPSMGGALTLVVKNFFNGADSIDGSSFTLSYGPSPTNLSTTIGVTMSDGTISTTLGGVSLTDPTYFIVKAPIGITSFARSGCMAVQFTT